MRVEADMVNNNISLKDVGCLVLFRKSKVLVSGIAFEGLEPSFFACDVSKWLPWRK